MATKTNKGGTERASNEKNDAPQNQEGMRREFDDARRLDMPGITGREQPADVIRQ